MGVFIVLAGMTGIILSYLIPIIARDTIRFIKMAYALNIGDWTMFLAEDYHPLHPCFIYLWYTITHNFITAARLASISLWLASFIPLYYIARRLFNTRIARITLALWAFHPYAARFAVDGLSEPCYIFFLLSSLWIGFVSFGKKRSFLLAFLAGIFASGAYLTRPEGIGIMIILCAVRLVYTADNRTTLKRISACIIIIIGFTVTSFPYIYFIHSQTGHWAITKKKPITSFLPSFLRHTPAKSSPDIQSLLLKKPHRIFYDNNTKPTVNNKVQYASICSVNKGNLYNFIMLNNTFIHALHPLLLAFLIIWLLFGVKDFRQDQKALIYLIISVLLLYYYVLFKLATTYYLSKRHLLPLAVLVLPFCAQGIETFCSWRFLHFRFSDGTKQFKPLLPILLIVLSILSVKTFKPIRRNKLFIKDIAQWLTINTEASAIYAVEEERIPFYANRNYIKLPNKGMSPKSVIPFLNQNHVKYILITKELREAHYDIFKKNKAFNLKYIFKHTDKHNGIVMYMLYEYIPSD